MSTRDGFDCEISIVQAFNKNFIDSGVTKIVNWYLVGSVYPMEPYPEEPAAMIAQFALERPLSHPRKSCGDTPITANSRKSAGSISTALAATSPAAAPSSPSNRRARITASSSKPRAPGPPRTSPSTSAAACPPANSASGAATPPSNSSSRPSITTQATAPSPSPWSPTPSIPFPPPPASKKVHLPTSPPTKISLSLLRNL